MTLTTVIRSSHPVALYHCTKTSRCRAKPVLDGGSAGRSLPAPLPPVLRAPALTDGPDADIVFRLYAREIGQVGLLTQQEEIALARRVKRGDKAAREIMIKANLRLVVKIARDFEGFGLPLLDLISEGNIGLMTAVERFDPGKGAKLSTYAAYYIKQGIRRAIADDARLIRLPVYAQDKLMLINRAEARLRQLLGHPPTDEDISAEIHLPAWKVRRLRSAAVCPISLDAPYEDDASRPISEAVPDQSAPPPDEQLALEDNRQLVQELMEHLPPRELQIIRRRFGFDQGPDDTLQEIGAELGLTRERIRQLQNSALRRLRANIKARESVHLAA